MCRRCIRANRQIIARLFTLSCKQSTELPSSLCALQSIKYMLVLFQEIPKQLVFLNCWNFVGCYMNSTSQHALFIAPKSQFIKSLLSDINQHPSPLPSIQLLPPGEAASTEYSGLYCPPAPAAYCATSCREDSDSTFWLEMKISELLIFQIPNSFQSRVQFEKNTARMSNHPNIFNFCFCLTTLI